MLNIHDEGFSFGHAQCKVIMICESGRDCLYEHVGTHFLVMRLFVVFRFYVRRASVESIERMTETSVGEVLAHSVVVSLFSERNMVDME